MRKGVVTVITLLLLIFVATSALAATNGDIRIYVDGKQVAFPDQQPYIDKNNRTLVPVRFVTESLGAKVSWLGKSKEVGIKHELKDKDIKLWVNQKGYLVNGQKMTMDTNAVLTSESRVVVPLRFVSEALGTVIRWEIVSSTGIVYTFTLGQSEQEIEKIMDQIGQEIKDEADKQTIVVAETGTPMKDMQWVDDQSSAKELMNIFPDMKISFITVDDLKKKDYKLDDDCSILDLRMDDKYIYVKEKGTGSPASMYLAEGNNLNRYRDPDQFTYTAGTYEVKYDIINDRRDQYIPMPTCDISKITYFILIHGEGCLAVKNPAYREGI